MNGINSLSHTNWRCQYHIVFAPKYIRQVIYGKIKADIRKILRKLCEQKGVKIIEAKVCKDHIHMLVSMHQYRLQCRFSALHCCLIPYI